MENFRRIDKNEVAALAGISVRTLFNHVAGGKSSPMLAGLPAPCTRGAGQRLTWIFQDVLDWLTSQRTFTPAAPAAPSLPLARNRGRPRKMVVVEGGAA